MSTVFGQPFDNSPSQDGPGVPQVDPQGPGAPSWRGRQRRHRVLLGGAALGVAAALAFGGLGIANALGPSTLTTAQIEARVDPGLVDIVSTLGYQGGTAAGTGM